MFHRNRIPVVVLLDNVAAEVSMERFYESYPSLSPRLVRPVLEWENRKAREALGLEAVA